MSLLYRSGLALVSIGLVAVTANAGPILQFGDPIIAFDFDTSSRSSYPLAEAPFNVADGDSATKYLNFGIRNSGFIVTPLAGPTTLGSMRLWTANDSPARDPAGWELWGTNDPIVSANNSDGMGGENWTLIGLGDVSLPNDRSVPGPLITLGNTTPYQSYRLTFPSVKDLCDANSMQVSEVEFFESDDGSGLTFLNTLDDFRAIHLPTTESQYPCLESPSEGIDGLSFTKYLNFGRGRSGFIVTPSVGPSVVRSFQFTTANDFPARDPREWELYGTNDPIVSTDNGTGDGESWTLIDSGAIVLPTARETMGDMVPVRNHTAYQSYRMVIKSIRNPSAGTADAMQFGDIQLFDDLLGPSGDFNNDGFWNCDDINALSAAVASGSTDLSFDMNGDGVISAADITDAGSGWLAAGGANNPAQTGGGAFLNGDANLSGDVDGSDFGIWNSNKFSNTSAWCSGDFNASGGVDGSDFGIWNGNKFMSSSSLATVPEPVAGAWLLLIVLGLRWRL